MKAEAAAGTLTVCQEVAPVPSVCMYWPADPPLVGGVHVQVPVVTDGVMLQVPTLLTTMAKVGL